MKVPLSFKEQVNKNSGALLEYLKEQYHESQYKKNICLMFTVHFGVCMLRCWAKIDCLKVK